jgi:hypothetical protein
MNLRTQSHKKGSSCVSSIIASRWNSKGEQSCKTGQDPFGKQEPHRIVGVGRRILQRAEGQPQLQGSGTKVVKRGYSYKNLKGIASSPEKPTPRYLNWCGVLCCSAGWKNGRKVQISYLCQRLRGPEVRQWIEGFWQCHHGEHDMA